MSMISIDRFSPYMRAPLFYDSPYRVSGPIKDYGHHHPLYALVAAMNFSISDPTIASLLKERLLSVSTYSGWVSFCDPARSDALSTERADSEWNCRGWLRKIVDFYRNCDNFLLYFDLIMLIRDLGCCRYVLPDDTWLRVGQLGPLRGRLMLIPVVSTVRSAWIGDILGYLEAWIQTGIYLEHCRSDAQAHDLNPQIRLDPSLKEYIGLHGDLFFSVLATLEIHDS